MAVTEALACDLMPIPELMWQCASEYIAHCAGLHFPPERRRELERGLASAAADLGFPDTHSCIEWLLEAPPGEPRLLTLASHLTSGDTCFFRDRGTFDVLATHVLPDLVRRGKRSLRLWSAACSTGEEPYSLAILAQQVLPDWREWDITILGTDINERSLHKAAEGIYGQWSFRNAPPGFKESFFTQTAKGRYSIREEIRQRVRFARLNLAQDNWPPLITGANGVDVILCHDVLTYFSGEQANKVAENLLTSLTDEGWLSVAPTECSQTRFAQFTPVNFPGCTWYRKPRGVTTLHSQPAPSPEPNSPTVESVALHASFARALANEGRLDEALEATERWIAQDKADPAAYYLQAVVRQELGHHDAARQCLQHVTCLNPNFVMARFALGNLALAEGHPAVAKRHFTHALELLRHCPPEEVLPESHGTTAAALTELINTLLTTPHTEMTQITGTSAPPVLIAADSLTEARRLQYILEQQGYRVMAAVNGREALECARRERPALIISDVATYEAAIERNSELASTRDELRHANQELQQLTQALEERVRARTSELELSNGQLRQAQQVLIQQERLRALGQMASGIAHDINNAVSPIALYTDLLLAHERTLSEGARDQLETIRHAIEDVARTVARMREFYRPHEPELQSVDIELNVLVRQVIDLTRARWSDQPRQRGETIELRTELAPHLPLLRGADNELRDALTNLIFNAVDAMPGGGTLEVCTNAVTNGSASVVCLEVRDTGAGMDEETRRRCERGTGLGLAMVYGMAQRHRAELAIDSQKGRGTTIRLLFPVSAATCAVPGNPVPAPAAATTGRGMRILVVDDDPMLSQSLRNILKAEGHEVSVAAGGRAGIDTFQAAQCTAEPFDVVITDLGMPHVDGRQVARDIRATSANVPIIMLTGWGRNLLADTTPPPEVSRLLNKPPRLSELRAALAELGASTCAVAPGPPREATHRDPG